VELLKRWNSEDGTVLQVISGMSAWKVIEVRSDVIACASTDSTRTLTFSHYTSHCYSLAKLSKDKFVSGGSGRRMIVWNEKGDRIDSIMTQYETTAITRVGDAIVSANMNRLEIRQLK